MNDNEEDLNIEQLIRGFIDYDNLDKFKNNITIRNRQDKNNCKLVSSSVEVSQIDNDFFEKNVLRDKPVKTKEVKNKTDSNFFCKFCNKPFKLNGKSIFNHELKCDLNPVIQNNFTLTQFCSLIKGRGDCVKCNIKYSNLKEHTKICLQDETDFKQFIDILYMKKKRKQTIIHLNSFRATHYCPNFHFMTVKR